MSEPKQPDPTSGHEAATKADAQKPPTRAPLAPGGTLDTLGRASLMGLHLVSGMIVGALLGYGLDRFFGIFPWCSGIGFLFGVGAGFRNMWIDARYLIRQGESARRPAAVKPEQTDHRHGD